VLSKQYRFPLSLEFSRIKKEGKLTNGPSFGVLTRERGDQSFSRFGFVVSTRVDKRAVVRHRLKRLLAEVVRLNLAKIKPGIDSVFLVKKTMIGLEFKQVEGEVLQTLGQNGFLI